ncbi:MAG: hypothetical protein OEZ03_00435 [Alphaproteobacteria bacterium]|nr:hypothetical protein [Alphaproteobacteria bacterium]
MGAAYKEDFSQVTLTTVEMGKVTMGLPAGWKPDPDSVDGEKVVAAFVNDAIGGYGEVKCYSVLVSFNTMQIFGQNDGIIAAGADPVHVAGPWALGANKYSRVFDVYTGTVTRKGQEVQVASYTGYNINTALSPCYAAVLVVMPDDKYSGEFNPVFAAMLDSVVTH